MIKERWSLEVVIHSKSSLSQNEYLCPEKGRVHRRCVINFVLSGSLFTEKLDENHSSTGDSLCQTVEVLRNHLFGEWPSCPVWLEGGMQEVKTGNERRPEVERFGLGTHILLSTVPLYFFWLCPEYFFLHPHLCEDHHFLRDTAQTYCSQNFLAGFILVFCIPQCMWGIA